VSRKAVWATGAAVAVTGAIALSAPTVFAETNGLTAAKPTVAPALLAASAADKLIATSPDLFHKSPHDVLEQRSVIQGGNLQYASFERSYLGKPVTHGDFVVVTDNNGRVLSTSVAQDATLSVGVTPKITAKAAAKTARAQVKKVDGVSKPRLTVIAKGAGVLAYEFVVDGRNGADLVKMHVFVNARTGKVVPGETWNEIVEGTGNGGYYKNIPLDTTSSGGSFTMVDPKRPGLQCGGQTGGAFSKSSDNWGDGTGTQMEAACADGLYSAQREWDMLKDWLGRNGIDGNGKGFPMKVGLAQVNAFWNGSMTSFGHSQDNKRQLTNMDVVGHEFGHGIFQFTPGGSNTENGQNEATGDIFGALTEAYANNPNDKPDYEVGELPNLVGNGPIRYMYDPSKNPGDPNCYSSKIPSTEVHAAAGPQNHWFYLLAEGSNPTNGQPKSPTCNNKTVTGIGIQKAGKIFLGGLMRKTSGWTHAKARLTTVQAAAELFPNSGECTVVKQAWDAVSVPAQSGEATCPAGNPGPTPTATPTAGPTTTPTSTPVPNPSTDIPTIDVSKAKAILDKFQSFADANGGTRRSGKAGHTATTDYIASTLEGAGYKVVKQACSPTCTGGVNVIADWPGGDENSVYMFGAHSDSVSAGPGINDNGSGSATIMALALTLAEKKPVMKNHVRFGWWADEEQGLNGSKFYTKNLAAAEKSKIKTYWNFDMVASPNGGYFINNINKAQSKGLKDYYDKVGIQTEENTEGLNRSDDASFTSAGIPASGIAAGASARMTSAQATKWGGKASTAYDSCYHSACDTTKNINDKIMQHAMNAQASALWIAAVGASTPNPGPTTGPTTNPNPAPGRTFNTTVKQQLRDYLTAYSPIVVSGVDGNAGSTVTLKVDAEHSCAQDLRIELRSPEGKTYSVVNSKATTDDCETFGSKTYEVKNVTSKANGTWELRIRDDYANDEGTLNGWSITL